MRNARANPRVAVVLLLSLGNDPSNTLALHLLLAQVLRARLGSPRRIPRTPVVASPSRRCAPSHPQARGIRGSRSEDRDDRPRLDTLPRVYVRPHTRLQIRDSTVDVQPRVRACSSYLSSHIISRALACALRAAIVVTTRCVPAGAQFGRIRRRGAACELPRRAALAMYRDHGCPYPDARHTDCGAAHGARDRSDRFRIAIIIGHLTRPEIVTAKPRRRCGTLLARHGSLFEPRHRHLTKH